MDGEDEKRSMMRRLDSIPHCGQTRALEDFKQPPDMTHLGKILPTECRTGWRVLEGGRYYDLCPGDTHDLIYSGALVCVWGGRGCVV